MDDIRVQINTVVIKKTVIKIVVNEIFNNKLLQRATLNLNYITHFFMYLLFFVVYFTSKNIHELEIIYF